jgi:feruloyl-CoA synthase
VVVAGGDRDEIAALIFPALEAVRQLAGAAADAPMDKVLSDPKVMKEFRARLTSFARSATGSSNRITRAILLAELPSLDAGEMTDKGSINQRAVLTRRANLVEELYSPLPSPRVLVIEKGK